MTTTDMIHAAGALTVLTVLVLTLAVILLRLVALPLAVAALVLDKAAQVAARPLTVTSPDWGVQR